MAKVSPRTLSGFMELLPAQQMKMERMMQILRDSYARYGFTPLDTPIIESAEVLLAPRAAARRRSRSTASRRATATSPCALT